VPSVIFVVLAMWAVAVLVMLIILRDERPRRLILAKGLLGLLGWARKIGL